MTITSSPSGVTFAHAAAMLAGHLADHALSEPVSLGVSTSDGHSTLTAQLRGDTLLSIAVDLLAWADTLNVVTVEAWRPPERDRVHLSLHGTLTGPAGAVEVKVFGAVDYDPLRFADLQPHPHRGMPLSLVQLRTWAANPPATMDTPVLARPRGAR
ncbi:MAG TPA: hypothetical protein VJT72_02630 [Pseudonocardiaceae bacterium]|nr:hypothetical protein [Pseudonocardiaceae bacterium]